MTAGESGVATVARWTLRVVLSGIFIYAGAVKMRDAKVFAESIASFRLLPDLLVTPAALTLPPLEILAALLALSAGRRRQVGVFCLLALLVGFTAILISALARGLQVDCGCFGPDRFDVLSPTKNLWVALGRDVVLIATAGFLYVGDSHRRAGAPRVEYTR